MGVYDRIEAILVEGFGKWSAGFVSFWSGLSAAQGLVVLVGLLAMCLYVSIRQPSRYTGGSGSLGGGFVFNVVLVSGLAFGLGWVLIGLTQTQDPAFAAVIGLR